MLALIDGDILVYKAAYATEYTVYKTSIGEFRRKSELLDYLKFAYDEDEAEEIISAAAPATVTEGIGITSLVLNSIINKIMRATDASKIKILLSVSGPKFRDSVEYPVKYKGGRPPKPSNYQATYDLLKSQPNCQLVSGIEVDDALGILQKQDKSTIICSIDKDLLQIPGLHFHIDKEVITEVTEKQGLYKFWHQMLTGDRVDNIIGLKGIGEKTADKILKDYGSDHWENIVKGEYIKAGQMEIYEANKVLLGILRNGDGYNYTIT